MKIRMMLVLAGLIAVPGLATAQMEEEELQIETEQTQPSQDPMMQQEPGAEVRTGMEMGEPQVEVFKNKDNFDLRGTVSSVDAQQNMITVQREEGLPPVELQIAQGTEIKMDGKQASLQQLQAGNEVRAKFNVAQDKPVAVELDAKPSKQQEQMYKDMEQMERDTEQMQR
ncbi:hypothetical protein [Vulgatibacter sp.]|uniref:hypothetical protein n=1 Tax=Vulgatibacter sp. TaxID=1971226 RepID=UPI0035688F63